MVKNANEGRPARPGAGRSRSDDESKMTLLSLALWNTPSHDAAHQPAVLVARSAPIYGRVLPHSYMLYRPLLAAAVVCHLAATTPCVAAASLLSDLRELATLFREGMLTDAEYLLHPIFLLGTEQFCIEILYCFDC